MMTHSLAEERMGEIDRPFLAAFAMGGSRDLSPRAADAVALDAVPRPVVYGFCPI
jgi:hypothetical protein